MIVSKSKKIYKVKTPGGRIVAHLKKKRHSYARCKNCGAKLNRFRLSVKAIKKLSKTEKHPARPLPELCSRCMRQHFKERVR